MLQRPKIAQTPLKQLTPKMKIPIPCVNHTIFTASTYIISLILHLLLHEMFLLLFIHLFYIFNYTVNC